MSMLSRAVTPVFLITFLVLSAIPASAQRKKDAPVYKPPPPLAIGPTEEFLRAYETLLYPKLVITVLSDGAGDSDRRAYESWMNQCFQDEEGLITVLDVGATTRRRDRESNVLEANDADGAVKMLANRTEADVAIVLTLDAATGAYVVHDIERGRRLGSGSWTRTASGIPEDIREECIEVSHEIFADITRFTRAQQPYTVGVIGMPASYDSAFRDALKGLPGVKSRVTATQDRGHGQSMTIFELRYGGGDWLDLRDSAAQALTRLIKLPVSPWTTRNGIIVLAVNHQPATETTLLLAGDPRTAAASGDVAEELARFGKAYRKAGSPKLTVFINQEVPLHTQVIKGDGSGQNVVLDTIEVDYANILQTRNIENDMFGRFGRLDVRCVNLRSAYDQAIKSADYQVGVFNNVEFAIQLAARDHADIMVFGIGKVIAQGKDYEIRYTFQAYRVRDSIIIGTCNNSATVPARDTPDFNTLLNKAEQRIAREAVGSLSVQMRDSWEPPSTIRFDVSNVQSHQALQAIEDWFIQNMPDHIVHLMEGTFRQGAEGGLGSFEVIYQTDFGTFTRALNEQSSSAGAPFTLVGEDVTPELIQLRAITN